MDPIRFVPFDAAAAFLALAPIGCGSSSKDTAGASAQSSVNRTQVDGAYRVTTSAKELAAVKAPGESPENWGTWTLVLDRGRFAFTRENDQACTWAYGVSTLRRNVMSWTVVDGGGLQPESAANEPGDRYKFKWSRFRDVLTLGPVKGAPAGYFAAKPWRRIAETPSAKYLSGRCPPPSAALQPTGAEGVTPPTGVELGVGGNLKRTSPTRWEGDVISKELGRGRLTVEGSVVFRPPKTRSRLTFEARFSKGELRGCGIVDNYRRPHGRYVWDGPGQITDTSPGYHKYLGLGMRFGGIIKIDDLNRVHGGFGTVGPGGVC
jgi:hypothetical protein